MSDQFEQFELLDGKGMDTLLTAIFQQIDEHYVRKSVYQTDIATLVARINVLNPDAVYARYNLSVDSDSGDLIFMIPDDEDITLYINDNGDLILVSNGTAGDITLASTRFYVNDVGDLIMTI